ncbi:MAG TPA: MBL fold metallo-hydrolase [Tepidiformaceae bacterium]|nr:MBL fold metallo-hydrolase [Tepidiformaceae bacterium]
MADMNLTFIGTGNAFAPGGSCYNGFLVNGRFLFEAPPSAMPSLNKLGLDANELEAVIISHHHGDHFLGLPFLLLHWKYMGRTRPIRIIGPPGTSALAQDIGLKVYPGLLDIAYEIEWIEATPGQSIEAGSGLVIEPVAVEHDQRLDWSLGYLCRLNGRSFGYTGDSRICDGVLDLARRSDVLVSECASVDETIDVHMNLRDDIPVVRAVMRPESQLILTHLGPGVEPDGLKNTAVAHDLQSFRT